MWELLNAENTMPNSLQISKEFKNSDLHLQLFYNAKIYFLGGGGVGPREWSYNVWSRFSPLSRVRSWGREGGGYNVYHRFQALDRLDFHRYLGAGLVPPRALFIS